MRMRRLIIPLVGLLCWISPAFADGMWPYTVVPAWHIRYTQCTTLTPGAEGSERCTVVIVVPQTIAGRQKVLKVDYNTVKPEKVFDENGNRYARFTFEDLKAPKVIRITVEAEVYRFDLGTAAPRKKKLAKKAEPADTKTTEDLSPWLAAERYLEKEGPIVQQTAASWWSSARC